jgi:hypothetical protein
MANGVQPQKLDSRLYKGLTGVGGGGGTWSPSDGAGVSDDGPSSGGSCDPGRGRKGDERGSGEGGGVVNRGTSLCWVWFGLAAGAERVKGGGGD